MRRSAKGIVLAATLTGCAPFDLPTPVDVVGRWQMNALHETDFATNGGACGDAVGFFEVTGSGSMSGQMTDTWGRTITHGGAQLIGSSITGKFLVDGKEAGSFSGTYSDGRWTGDYAGTDGCNGIWTGVRLRD